MSILAVTESVEREYVHHKSQEVRPHSVTQASSRSQYLLLLRLANTGLLLSTLLLLATVLMCYPFESMFTMHQLIAGHLIMIASATLVKICYVGRCIAQYSLQQEVR